MDELQAINDRPVSRQDFDKYRDEVMVAMRRLVEVNHDLMTENKQLRKDLEESK